MSLLIIVAVLYYLLLYIKVEIRFRSGKLFKLSRLRASTKVLEELIQELLYADDCALEAHTLHDIQALTDSFANSASRFGLTINIQKTEVMFQPAPGKAYSNPQVNINGVSLKLVSQFCYLGSTLSNDALLDKEITNRISKASSSYGMLSDRVWKQHGIKTLTKSLFTRLLYYPIFFSGVKLGPATGVISSS